MSRVRTRFAPSPTGSLHVGNARTAALNWLVARHHGGDFILRIEDTDVERTVANAEPELMADLQWLGLEWDEGPDPDGPGERGDHGPYRQSRRSTVYQEYAARLLEAGAAYRCFCEPERPETERGRAAGEGRPSRYPGTCRELGVEEAAERAAADQPHVLRLRTPRAGPVRVEDIIRGTVTVEADTLDDFVLVRSDGRPTYNFAVVVDDAEMAISHVIRGVGHLSNTPQQVLLYQALGLDPPHFAHIPTVLAEDRSKLSKRSGARPLRALREEGVHPDAVLNYLSLLGWSSPSGDEILSRDRLIEEISLERINPGDVVFDPEKMRWLSGQHIARMDLDALADAVRPHLADSPCSDLLDGRFHTALAAVRSRLTAFGDVTEHLASFLGPDPENAIVLDAEQRDVVAAVREALAALDDWTQPSITEAVRSAGASVGAKGKSLYVPVRQALTGEDHGPPLSAVLEVQGREVALEHLAAAVEGRAGAV